jgi:hypothetical protein
MATGGTMATGGASTGGASTGGVPGCPPIPSEVQYTCPPRAFEPGDCWPYGFQTNIRIAAGYPEGCEAILPQRDGFSGCGPQRCACATVLDSAGVKTGVWECPL